MITSTNPARLASQLALSLIAASLTLVACGGDDEQASPADASQ